MPAPERKVIHTFEARVEDLRLDVTTRTIEAAYFVDEGAFTVFKNPEHQAVYAVRSDRLLSVERVKLAQDESSSR